MQQLHIRIGQLMEKHGYTNQSLADASGVPIGTISGIRSGKIRSPSYSAICAMLSAMGEPVDALNGAEECAGEAEDVPLQNRGFTDQQRAIMDKSCQIASLSARLDAYRANVDKYAALEAELRHERRKNHRLQITLTVLILIVIALMAVYLWDVTNLHSGLTAYFNQ